jgi:KaiC/GvpD/RAD55 family RecA-like ATPase
MEKNSKLPKNKTIKILMYLADHAHRWAGAIIGMPGTGKTQLLHATYLVLQEMGRKAIFIRVKECSEEYIEIAVPEKEILQHISGILQFTAHDGFRVSFDRLTFTQCSSIECLINYVEKKYREDIADWVVARLYLLSLNKYLMTEICFNSTPL